MFDDKFNYRITVEKLIAEMGKEVDVVRLNNNDAIDEWDSMKNIIIKINDDEFSIYWEREIGYILASCDSQIAAEKISMILDKLWPDTDVIPACIRPDV